MRPSVAGDATWSGLATAPVAQAGGVLPEGFVVPPLAYAIVLLVGVVTIAVILWTLSPPVSHQTTLALGAWMMVGGTLHALYQLREFPDVVEPLLATPAIYATIAIVAGTLWVITTLYGAMSGHSPDRTLGVFGAGAFVVLLAWGLVWSVQTGTLSPLPAVVALVGTAFVAAVTWLAVGLFFTDAAAITSWTGAVVVFSHALDGMTTAVGHDVLGAAERTPLSATVLDVGEMLPTAQYIGAGWLFVFVKLLLAAAIVVLFRDWVREDPRPALLVLIGLAAVGLGPGIHNLVLFALGSG